MWQLEDISESEIGAIKTYPGLIGILLYEPSSKHYEKAIRGSYPELHVQSDRSLLLIAGRSDWVSEEDRRAMRNDVRRTKGEAMIEMLVSIAPSNRFEAARQMVTLQNRFGVKRSELPCLLLIESVDATAGYIYPFDHSVLENMTDNATRALTEVFEVCSKAVDAQPCPVSGVDADGSAVDYKRLLDWRRETLQRVQPTLSRLRVVKAARKLAPAVLPGAIKGLAGLA